MKYIRFVLTSVVILATITSFSQSQTDTIKVWGNCGMCKKRIEKTVKLDGVSTASWSPETKLLIISYDAAKISNDDIQKAVAAVGHDTEKYTADDAVYSKLPGCCLYDRKKKDEPKKQLQ